LRNAFSSLPPNPLLLLVTDVMKSGSMWGVETSRTVVGGLCTA